MMWGSLWRNCVWPQCSDLSQSERLRMLDRSVRPVFFFRNTRWAWTRTLAQAQDRLKRSMLSQFLRLEHLPPEDAAAYNRRRMRDISNLVRGHGTWGQLHAQRVVSWASHLERPRNSRSVADRLGTRTSSGPVATRCDHGFVNARMELRT